jgi:hypothetical protein
MYGAGPNDPRIRPDPHHPFWMTLDRVSSTIGRRGSLRVRSAQPASLAYTNDDAGGAITHTPAPDYLDDGPEKPIRIWSRTGRRPLVAAGNTNGDLPISPSANMRKGNPCAYSSRTTTRSASLPTPPAQNSPRHIHTPRTNAGSRGASAFSDATTFL